MSEPRYVLVAIPLGFRTAERGTNGLTYEIPHELSAVVSVGMRVVVPLGTRRVTGVVVECPTQKPSSISHVRPIEDVLDRRPVFDSAFLKWTKWIAQYYLTSWGEVLETALPQGLRTESKNVVKVSVSDVAQEIKRLKASSKRRAEVLERIASYPDGVVISHLAKRSKIGGLYGHIHQLAGDGLVTITSRERTTAKAKTITTVALAPELVTDSSLLSAALVSLERSPSQAKVLLKLLERSRLAPNTILHLSAIQEETGASASTIRSLEEKGYIERGKEEIAYELKASDTGRSSDSNVAITLTGQQQNAHDIIASSLRSNESKTFLIHGITGSGKTEVYICLVRDVLSRGEGALVLVPEIALTPQLIERFQKRLADLGIGTISVLHSRMSERERYSAWQALANGQTRIAIGARSAVFAPVQNLKLIIVDEEHEVTYKQYDSSPRYHARDAAIMRAHMLGGVSVLGSATPSLESYYNAEQGKYELLQLSERALAATLPPVRVIDRRQPVRRADIQQTQPTLSDELLEAIGSRLRKREGVVLLQNRRGFSTYLACSHCGTTVICPNCAVTLTWHRSGNRMECHYCGFKQHRSQICATCGSDKLYLGGIGTERVEDELRTNFSDVRILRMDLDTTSKRGAYESILRSFGNGEADILLGTQMVAKGLDFPRVTLVGVINADTSLCLPDFRSSERTFQLLTQVSGRAGRTEELAGEVIVQTFQPSHPAIVHAANHDFEAFYAHEKQERIGSDYPPFSRLILVEFRGKDESQVDDHARWFTALLPENTSFYRTLGPAQPAIGKLRGEFRSHLVIKDLRSADPGGEKIRNILEQAQRRYQDEKATRTVSLIIDIDVQGVL